MIDFSTLQRAYVSLFLSGYVSVKLLKDELSVSEKEAEEVIKELSLKGAISGFDFAKGEMLLLTEKELDSLLEKVKNDEVKENLKKDFCVYNNELSMFTLEPIDEEEIDAALIEKAKGLKEQYGKLTSILIHKELKIGLSKAVKVLKIIEEQG